MTRILIPDAGPLFSLAAADILAVLLNFRVAITDVVKQESIDKGRLPRSSIEAKRLWSFYEANSESIELRETQFGKLLAQARAADSSIRFRNAGELSIQSLMIELREEANRPEVVLLFEDSWFLQHAPSLPRNCELVSTSAFLHILEKLGLIASARAAREDIRKLRRDFFSVPEILRGGTSGEEFRQAPSPRSRRKRS